MTHRKNKKNTQKANLNLNQQLSVKTAHMCVLITVHYTIQHRTVLTIFALILRTIVNTQILSTAGEGKADWYTGPVSFGTPVTGWRRTNAFATARCDGGEVCHLLLAAPNATVHSPSTSHSWIQHGIITSARTETRLTEACL